MNWACTVLFHLLLAEVCTSGLAALVTPGTYFLPGSTNTFNTTYGANLQVTPTTTWADIDFGVDGYAYLVGYTVTGQSVVVKAFGNLTSSVWENLLTQADPFTVVVHPDQQSIFAGVRAWGAPLPFFASMSSVGGFDAYVVKLSTSTGAILDVLHVADSSVDEFHTRVHVDSGGEVYAQAVTAGATSAPGATAQGEDIVLTKFDAAGSRVYIQQHGTANHERLMDATMDGTHVYVVGYASIHFTTSAAFSSYAIFVGKYLKSDGSVVWHTFFDGSGADYGKAIVTTYSSSVVYVMGEASPYFSPFVNARGYTSGIVIFSLNKSDGSYSTLQVAEASVNVDFGGRACISKDESLVTFFGVSNADIVPGNPSTGGYDFFTFTYNIASETLASSQMAGTNYNEGASGCGYNYQGDFFGMGHVIVVADIGYNYVYQPLSMRLTNTSSCEPGSYYYKWDQFEQCRNCPSGTYTVDYGQTTCLECPTGSIGNTGRTGCEPCAAGTYQNGLECAACTAGATSTTGSTSCIPCPSGYYEASNKCEACPLGSYSEEGTASECTTCPYQSTTLQTASASVSECVCTSDQYGDPHGNPPVNCENCMDNAHCDGSAFAVPIAGYALATTERDYSVRCVPLFACPGERDICNNGYSGLHCTDCESGTFRGWFQSACVPCPSEGSGLAVSTPLLLLVLAPGISFIGLLFYACEVSRRLLLQKPKVDDEQGRESNGSDEEDTPEEQLGLAGGPLEIYMSWQASTSVLIIISGLHLGTNSSVAQYISVLTSPLLLGLAWPLPMFECFSDRVPALAYAVRVVVGPMMGLGVVAIGSFVSEVLSSMLTYVRSNVSKGLVPTRARGHEHRSHESMEGGGDPAESSGSKHDSEVDTTSESDDGSPEKQGVVEAAAQGHDRHEDQYQKVGQVDILGWMGSAAIVAAGRSLEAAVALMCVLVANVLDPIRCVEFVPGEWRQVTSPDVQCYSGESNWLSSLAIMLVALPLTCMVPVVVIVATVLKALKKGTSNAYVDRVLSSLWYRYSASLFWWDSLRVIMSLVMSFSLVIFCGSIYDQATVITIAQLFKVVLTASFRPFKSSLVDYLELVVEGCSGVFMVCVLLGSQDAGRVSKGGSGILHFAAALALGINLIVPPACALISLFWLPIDRRLTRLRLKAAMWRSKFNRPEKLDETHSETGCQAELLKSLPRVPSHHDGKPSEASPGPGQEAHRPIRPKSVAPTWADAIDKVAQQVGEKVEVGGRRETTSKWMAVLENVDQTPEANAARQRFKENKKRLAKMYPK